MMKSPHAVDLEPSHSEQEAAAKRQNYKRRESTRGSVVSGLLDPESLPQSSKNGSGAVTYADIIKRARRYSGHGGIVGGAFLEEWDAQMLVDCGRTQSGHRLVIFVPAFLKPHLEDQLELDHAVEFILLAMDAIAMHEKYVFVYCDAGVELARTSVAFRLRVVYDLVPRQYSKNLRKLYVLHPTPSLRLMSWACWPWISSRLWNKIEYVSTLDDLCAEIYPSNNSARMSFRRHFPQIIHREDAYRCSTEALTTFGVPIRRLCDTFGVDFKDKTTGRWYPRLPPALVFLCESLERQAAAEAFSSLFSVDKSTIYEVVVAVDEGEPLHPDVPVEGLWCALKLFLDCLPDPLLSFQAYNQVKLRNIKTTDSRAHVEFLKEVIHFNISKDSAYMALYLASFLHTVCFPPSDPTQEEEEEEDEQPELTPHIAAVAFTPGFLRPRMMSEIHLEAVPAATAIIETFIQCAEDPELWIGERVEEPEHVPSDESDHTSALSEGDD